MSAHVQFSISFSVLAFSMEEDDLRLRTSSRSVSVVPETPEEEEYFDAQDAGDDIEEEDVEGDVELEVEGREADEDEKLIELDGMVDTVNVGQLSVPVIVDMDEDGELETEVDGQQLLMAPSIVNSIPYSRKAMRSTESTARNLDSRVLNIVKFSESVYALDRQA